MSSYQSNLLKSARIPLLLSVMCLKTASPENSNTSLALDLHYNFKHMAVHSQGKFSLEN